MINKCNNLSKLIIALKFTYLTATR